MIRAGMGGAPLAQVLRAAAPVWGRVRAGQSLERAIALHDGPAGSPSTPLAAAVRDVCHDTLRHRALIEAVLARLVPRAASALAEGLLASALSQLLDGAYPDYVVVDQAVGAARADARLRPAAGFVNAVLRTFLRRRALWLPQLTADDATRLNVPPWWLRRTQRDHPHAWAQVLQAGTERPPLVLRVNEKRITVQDYLALLEGQGLAASRVGRVAVWLHRPGPVARIPGFADGRVSVQDAGAQLAAPWLDVREGMRALDVCAAPGGKTGHLAELGEAQIDAVELDAARCARIGQNLLRLGLQGPRVRVFSADAMRPDSYWDGRPYERVLLDAPCTGSGIVRRHADIPWLRRESDVAQLATIQAGLLDAMWPLLAPAGRLLYVVCSVFHDEAAQQADAFLERHPDARATPLPGTNNWSLQLLPARADHVERFATAGLPTVHDGFFYALFEKAA